MATDGEWTGFGIVDWSDAELHADQWFMLANVTPLQAAMLLCGQNPNGDDAEGKAERTTTDSIKPSDFRALRTTFQGQTAPAGQATDLETWVRLARSLSLRYDPWVDAYMAAADLPALKARREAALADAFRQPKNDDEQAGNGATGPVPGNPAVGAASDWKQLARDEARRIRKYRKGLGWTPNLVILSEEVAALFLARGINGANGHTLAATYIKRWALQGHGVTNDANRLRSTLNARGK